MMNEIVPHRWFMRFCAACILAVIGGNGAFANETARERIQHAFDCLHEINNLRGLPAYTDFKLKEFVRKLANDIDVAETQVRIDPDSAALRLGEASCEQRLARWVATIRPEEIPNNAIVRSEMAALLPSADIPTDPEQMMRARQAAIQAVLSYQSRRYVGQPNNRNLPVLPNGAFGNRY